MGSAPERVSGILVAQRFPHHSLALSLNPRTSRKHESRSGSSKSHFAVLEVVGRLNLCGTGYY